MFQPPGEDCPLHNVESLHTVWVYGVVSAPLRGLTPSEPLVDPNSNYIWGMFQPPGEDCPLPNVESLPTVWVYGFVSAPWRGLTPSELWPAYDDSGNNRVSAPLRGLTPS